MIPHKVKIQIVKALVKEENLKASRTVWGRELKLLKQLGDAKYDDADFWLNLRTGYSLNSLAFFKSERGDMELQQAWRLYQLDKQAQKVVDSNIKPDNIDLTTTQPAQQLPSKETPLAWADS